MRKLSDFFLLETVLDNVQRIFVAISYAIVNLRECIRGYHKVQEHRWGCKYLKMNIMWNNVRPNQNDFCRAIGDNYFEERF